MTCSLASPSPGSLIPLLLAGQVDASTPRDAEVDVALILDLPTDAATSDSDAAPADATSETTDICDDDTCAGTGQPCCDESGEFAVQTNCCEPACPTGTSYAVCTAEVRCADAEEQPECFDVCGRRVDPLCESAGERDLWECPPLMGGGACDATPFRCGEGFCDLSTEACLTSAGGPVGTESSSSCVPLPTRCATPSCDCFADDPDVTSCSRDGLGGVLLRHDAA